MVAFALELIKTSKALYPGSLAQEWNMHKRGRYAPCASRDRFGLTSASYRVLRSLCKEGILVSTDDHKYTLNPTPPCTE